MEKNPQVVQEEADPCVWWGGRREGKCQGFGGGGGSSGTQVCPADGGLLREGHWHSSGS